MRKVLSCSAVLKCILCPGGLRVSGLVLILHIDIQFPQNCSLKLLPFLQCVFNFFLKKENQVCVVARQCMRVLYSISLISVPVPYCFPMTL